MICGWRMKFTGSRFSQPRISAVSANDDRPETIPKIVIDDDDLEQRVSRVDCALSKQRPSPGSRCRRGRVARRASRSPLCQRIVMRHVLHARLHHLDLDRRAVRLAAARATSMPLRLWNVSP